MWIYTQTSSEVNDLMQDLHDSKLSFYCKFTTNTTPLSENLSDK